jgi:hypothetical protein
MWFKTEVNPSTGGWELFLKNGMFSRWARLLDSTSVAQSFYSYDEVVAFVTERGINRVYRLDRSIFHYYPPASQAIEASGESTATKPNPKGESV